MSTAANHRKRSHRSQRAHYGQARILRRQNAARYFERTPLIGGMFQRMRAKILRKPERESARGGDAE
ncbi:MAG: hypothetical protein IKI69_04125 [Oscillospiraceae bacterium]|nr:hypothetical protein [Oscillospiraceae bacterium]